MSDTLDKQVQLGIFTLLIGIGFFKLNELKTFVDTLAEIIVTPTLLSITLVGAGVILYIIYLFSIGFGLYKFFKNEPGVNKAMIMALGCFFAFYCMLLLYNLSNTELKFAE